LKEFQKEFAEWMKYKCKDTFTTNELSIACFFWTKALKWALKVAQDQQDDGTAAIIEDELEKM